MSKIFALFFFFMFSPAVFSAEKPLVIGKLEVPSLMSVTEDLSRISETVSPGSSIMLVMGLTALSFAPELKDFDLTSNISAYLYLFEKNKVKVVDWCAVFNKKSNVSLEKTDGKNKLFVKEIAGKAVVAYSRELLDQLTEIPADSSASSDEGPTGILISFKPGLYLKNCGADYLNVKNDLIRQLAMKYHKDGDSGLIRSKTAQVRIEYLEKILSQTAEIKMNVRLKKEGIVCKLALMPADGSQLKAFIGRQKDAAPELLPFAKGKNFVASGSFILTDALKKASFEMFRDIAMEVSEEEKNNGYADIIESIAGNSSGKFTLFMDVTDGKTWNDAAVRMQPSKDGSRNLKDIFDRKYSAMKTGIDKFYRLSDVKSGENKSLKTFCMLQDGAVSFYEGEAAPADAVKVIEEGFKSMEPVDDIYSGCFLVVRSREAPDAAADELTLSFTDGSAALRLYVTADTVRGFLPREWLSKQKKKENKNKNMRMRNPL